MQVLHKKNQLDAILQKGKLLARICLSIESKHTNNAEWITEEWLI